MPQQSPTFTAQPRRKATGSSTSFNTRIQQFQRRELIPNSQHKDTAKGGIKATVSTTENPKGHHKSTMKATAPTAKSSQYEENCSSSRGKEEEEKTRCVDLPLACINLAIK
ncbi:hypothetical protein KFK09_019765 [Dendrobium nobile]|uniref:Uncharacterized protein n=1 Tax=Dendrobium nobile TaxID=94219 RepID=A0A8T3ARW9_DENNO|nr:hypothetical protein KFK09_019765 [Dendrobium nobile]